MEQHSFTSTKRQTNGKTILRYPVKISSKVKAGFRESQFSFNQGKYQGVELLGHIKKVYL